MASGSTTITRNLLSRSSSNFHFHPPGYWSRSIDLENAISASILCPMGSCLRRSFFSITPSGSFYFPRGASLSRCSSLNKLLFNNTRPLIGKVPWPTRVGSILNTPTAEIMFAINPDLMPSYIEATDVIQDSNCTRVGLRIDSDDLEYLFWWLLDAPQSGIQIESIFTYSHLEPLIDWDFKPCAILCTICGDRTRLHGLPLTGDFSRVNLFTGEGFTLDIDG